MQFASTEVSLIIEALARAGRRQASEARWYYARDNKKLGDEHDDRARAMLKLVNKLKPLVGLKGAVRS